MIDSYLPDRAVDLTGHEFDDVLKFFKENDTTGVDPEAKFDYRDRYKVIGESIPSNPKIIIRDGRPEIFISVGGGLPTIKSPPDRKPIEIINWREMRN